MSLLNERLKFVAGFSLVAVILDYATTYIGLSLGAWESRPYGGTIWELVSVLIPALIITVLGERLGVKGKIVTYLGLLPALLVLYASVCNTQLIGSGLI